jgi:hypothetical protein
VASASKMPVQIYLFLMLDKGMKFNFGLVLSMPIMTLGVKQGQYSEKNSANIFQIGPLKES